MSPGFRYNKTTVDHPSDDRIHMEPDMSLAQFLKAIRDFRNQQDADRIEFLEKFIAVKTIWASDTEFPGTEYQGFEFLYSPSTNEYIMFNHFRQVGGDRPTYERDPTLFPTFPQDLAVFEHSMELGAAPAEFDEWEEHNIDQFKVWSRNWFAYTQTRTFRQCLALGISPLSKADYVKRLRMQQTYKYNQAEIIRLEKEAERVSQRELPGKFSEEKFFPQVPMMHMEFVMGHGFYIPDLCTNSILGQGAFKNIIILEANPPAKHYDYLTGIQATRAMFPRWLVMKSKTWVAFGKETDYEDKPLDRALFMMLIEYRKSLYNEPDQAYEESIEIYDGANIYAPNIQKIHFIHTYQDAINWYEAERKILIKAKRLADWSRVARAAISIALTAWAAAGYPAIIIPSAIGSVAGGSPYT